MLTTSFSYAAVLDNDDDILPDDEVVLDDYSCKTVKYVSFRHVVGFPNGSNYISVCYFVDTSRSEV